MMLTKPCVLVFLTSISWAKILRAVALHEDCSIPLGNMSFRLKWIRPAFKSPFNGLLLEGYDVTDTIIPPLTKSHVEVIGMAMQHEPVRTIISSMAICEYVERIRRMLCELIPPHPPDGIWPFCQTFTVRLQLPTLPGGALATKCEPTNAGLDVDLVSNLIMYVPLEFRDTPPEGQLVYLFQIDFGLWRHGETSAGI